MAQNLTYLRKTTKTLSESLGLRSEPRDTWSINMHWKRKGCSNEDLGKFRHTTRLPTKTSMSQISNLWLFCFISDKLQVVEVCIRFSYSQRLLTWPVVIKLFLHLLYMWIKISVLCHCVNQLVISARFPWTERSTCTKVDVVCS